MPRPIPQPASTYKIKELEVNAKLADQVAKVQVTQSFVNTGSRQMEVCVRLSRCRTTARSTG